MAKSLAAVIASVFGIVAGAFTVYYLEKQGIGFPKPIAGALAGAFAGIFGGSIGGEMGGKKGQEGGIIAVSVLFGIAGGVLGGFQGENVINMLGTWLGRIPLPF